MTDWTCPRCGRRFLVAHARHACTSQAPEEFFALYPAALPIYRATLDALRASGPVEVEATRSQVAFRAGRRFAFLWIPAMALRRGPPDVYLTFDLARRERSPRIKQSVQARPGLWTHHLLVASPGDMDEQALGWLREAYLLSAGAARAPRKPRSPARRPRSRRAPRRSKGRTA